MAMTKKKYQSPMCEQIEIEAIMSSFSTSIGGSDSNPGGGGPID